ncbi:MAG: energy transducer TonB [Pseudomonadota bacterium]
MYADRLNPRHEIKPGSMALALVVTALPIVGLVTATHAGAIAKWIEPPTVVTSIPLPKDPPPEPPKKVETRNPPPITLPYVPPVTPPLIPRTDSIETGIKLLPYTPPGDPGTGTDIGTKITPPPPLVIVGTQYDPRYNNVLQPPYPADMIRAGESGRVVVRVLIGADGRVKQVEFVSGANGSFFESTQRQALAKWRFKPATRDGVPFEQWKTMSLRFELANVE